MSTLYAVVKVQEFSRLSGACSNLLSYQPIYYGGDMRIRTADPLLAKQVLYQLSYTPMQQIPSVIKVRTLPI